MANSVCKSGRLLERVHSCALFFVAKNEEVVKPLSKFPLSQKYIDFINSVNNVSADFLEGT